MKSLTAITWPGLVPQVTCGAMSAAFKVTTLSKRAPLSDFSVRQYATASSHSAPFGANWRPRAYSKVVSSGATRPAFAPSSIAILHSVMRPSMLNASTAGPQNSTTWPLPPPLPVLPMIASAISLAVMPGAVCPTTSIFMVLARDCFSVWVASTCSTSEVPIPNASAPKAP